MKPLNNDGPNNSDATISSASPKAKGEVSSNSKAPRMLTPSEIASLRQDKKDSSAKLAAMIAARKS
jgi:DNA-binding transcriptional regulator YiaG